MQGRHQLEAFIRTVDPATLPVDRFVRLDTGRVQCVLCGRTGTARAHVGPLPIVERDRSGRNVTPDDPRRFDGRGRPVFWGLYFPYSPWQIGCLIAHDWECACGRTFPTYLNLWRHIGADRPAGWGRQGDHAPVLACAYPRTIERKEAA